MTPTTAVQIAPDMRRVKRAVIASYVTFGGAGFAIASWASRIPQVRDRLHLEPSALGLVLLAVAVGSLLALPLSGPMIARFGSRRTVTVTAVLLGVALLTVAFGYRIGVAPVVVGLFLFGLAAGAWDVAINVHGAYVEQQLGRSIMSRFHAGFSLGTVTGALVGAAMVAGEVSVTVHLVAAALVLVPSVIVAATRFLPEHDHDHSPVAVHDTSSEAAESSKPALRSSDAARSRPGESRAPSSSGSSCSRSRSPKVWPTTGSPWRSSTITTPRKLWALWRSPSSWHR